MINENPIFQPFSDFAFDDFHCFLTGEKTDGQQFMPIFPDWLCQEFGLADQPFKLLDESFTTYIKLTLPCSQFAMENFITPLQNKVKAKFKNGYSDFSTLSDLEIFQWTGLMMYGIIVTELKLALSQRENNEPLSIAPSLIKKFTHHHLALLSLTGQIEFDEVKPWSIFLMEVKQGAYLFDYRDELNTMIFSAQFNGIGLIICLQDNGANAIYHEELYQKTRFIKLHPIQFQEFAARIYYSGYLLNPTAEYVISKKEGKSTMSALPYSIMPGKQLFARWENKTYGQVLEAFWKTWGFVKFEILKNPEKPISFIENENGILNELEIDLPL